MRFLSIVISGSDIFHYHSDAAIIAAGNGLGRIVVKKSTTQVQALAAFGRASMDGLVPNHS